MYSKLVFVSSLLIFVTVFSSLMNVSLQSGATASDQFFFDAQTFTGQPLVNESVALESVAKKTNKFSAQVFNHKNFTGNHTTITQNTPLINDQFQDSISSLIIAIDGNRSPGYMVEVCEHKSYAGSCMILGSGKHNVQTLGWLNDQISSLRGLSPETLDLKNIKPGLITNGSN